MSFEWRKQESATHDIKGIPLDVGNRDERRKALKQARRLYKYANRRGL